jgi:peptidoglycan/LPS O-acetylase OafA/YrhL
VLSAFVLPVAYHRSLVENTLDRRRFWIRRVARLYPAYLLSLALMVPLFIHARWGQVTGAFPDPSFGHNALRGIVQALMLQSLWPRLALSWNLPSWSVSVELAAYAVFPFAATWLARQSSARLVRLMGLTWLASLAVTVAYSVLNPDGRAVGADTSAFYIDIVKFSPAARLPEFFLGVMLGVLYKQRPHRSSPWLGLVALAVLVGTLANARAIPFAVLHNSLLLPVYLALVWALATGRGRVTRFFSSRPLVAVGKASYDVYILQMPLMYLLLLVCHYAQVELPGIKFMLVFLPILIGAAWLVYATVERHGKRLLERWLLQATRSRSGSAAALGITPAATGAGDGTSAA